MLSAHYDHLGLVAAGSDSDRVYNGADDNASGCAAVLEVARRLASGPPLERSDHRSCFTSGEEAGSARGVPLLPAPTRRAGAGRLRCQPRHGGTVRRNGLRDRACVGRSLRGCRRSLAGLRNPAAARSLPCQAPHLLRGQLCLRSRGGSDRRVLHGTAWGLPPAERRGEQDRLRPFGQHHRRCGAPGRPVRAGRPATALRTTSRGSSRRNSGSAGQEDDRSRLRASLRKSNQTMAARAPSKRGRC